MAVPAPPGMQPWVRQMDRRVADTERGLRAQQQSSSRSRRVSQYDEALDAVTSPLGITPDWHLVIGGPGPSISGEAVGDRVKVTITTVCEGVRNGAAAGEAGGLMRVTLQPLEIYRVSPRADDNGGSGLGASFSYTAGSGLTQRFSGSYSQVLILPVGPYTVRSEYLYTQSTANVAVRWSQRTMMIEPF